MDILGIPDPDPHKNLRGSETLLCSTLHKPNPLNPCAGGRVIAVKADLAKIGLTTPVCTEVGEKIALSRR